MKMTFSNVHPEGKNRTVWGSYMTGKDEWFTHSGCEKYILIFFIFTISHYVQFKSGAF